MSAREGGITWSFRRRLLVGEVSYRGWMGRVLEDIWHAQVSEVPTYYCT